MAIEVVCSECSKGYRVPVRYAGQCIPCKRCGADMDVPRSRATPSERDEGYTLSRQRSSTGRRAVRAVHTPVQSSPEPEGRPLSIVLIVGGPIVGLLLAMVLASKPGEHVWAIVAGVMGAVLVLWGGLTILGIAFREDILCGLMYLFVPFYSLYYVSDPSGGNSSPAAGSGRRGWIVPAGRVDCARGLVRRPLIRRRYGRQQQPDRE